MARTICIEGRNHTIMLPRGIFMAIKNNEQLKELVIDSITGKAENTFLAVSQQETDPDTGFTTTSYLPIDSYDKLRKVCAANGKLSIQYKAPKQTSTQTQVETVDFRALLA